MSTKPKSMASGLRRLRTLHTTNDGTLSHERHHLVSRFARLENERARLEHEVEMWDTRKKATDDKLAKLREQLAELQALLLEGSAKASAARRASSAGQPRAAKNVAGTPSPASRNISLEY